MEQQLIKQEVLDNGITLLLYDASRKIIGDRWLVALVARAVVPVKDALRSAEEVTPDELLTIQQALGEEVLFEQKRERLFIDENEKDTVFNEILESFLAKTRLYLSHPEFPVRFVHKSFRENLAKKKLSDQMNSRQ